MESAEAQPRIAGLEDTAAGSMPLLRILPKLLKCPYSGWPCPWCSESTVCMLDSLRGWGGPHDLLPVRGRD